MTHTLTRLFTRTKREQEPDYVQPYFWHRYWVWWWLSLFVGTVITNVLDHFWSEIGYWQRLPFWLLFYLTLTGQAGRNRRRWAKRVTGELTHKLKTWAEVNSVSEYDVGEAVTRFSLLTQELEIYITRPLGRRSLSARLTPWEGSGTKFTVYERDRKKRVYTFYHN